MAAEDKIRIKDLAKSCGVSPATISRYFNQPSLLSESAKARIKEELDKTRYTQDRLAKILVTGKSNIIGVILPHLQFGFYTELLNQLIEKGREKGYKFIPYTSNISKEDEISQIRDLCSYHIKGLILLSPLLNAGDIEQLPVPVISVERSGGNFMQINNDGFTGGKLAGELLIQNKCEVFIHINNDYSTSWPSFKRIVGFECVVHDQPYERVICHELTEPYRPSAKKSMHDIVDSLLKKYAGKKWGVFCSNDDIAKLFEQQCILRGIRIPEEIELIGYDNSPVSEQAVYTITSIDQNIPSMASMAIDGFDIYQPYETIVPSRLIKKETTS